MNERKEKKAAESDGDGSSYATPASESDRVTRSNIQFLETPLKKKRDRIGKNTTERYGEGSRYAAAPEGRAPCSSKGIQFLEALLKKINDRKGKKAAESYGEGSSYAAAWEGRAPCSSDRVTRSFLGEALAKRNNDRKCMTDGEGSSEDQENTAEHWYFPS
ncbi:hypothetical protein A2U01_0023133 [Trifolium medium]|uniref:Uncharacterized protein n=1 Tax=Trifolium medium TaxID=97028 RepID=A0A392NQH6_9FABA|nr:hypothetical protein [Trifolium medium]